LYGGSHSGSLSKKRYFIKRTSGLFAVDLLVLFGMVSTLLLLYTGLAMQCGITWKHTHPGIRTKLLERLRTDIMDQQSQQFFILWA
jgi:hypothetical protein